MWILFSLFALAACAAPLASAAGHTAAESCTHGKLYVFDNETALVHVMDVSKGMLEGLTVETTVQLPEVGAGELVVYGFPEDPLVVQYRGVEPDFEGFVRVVDTGFSYVDGQVMYAEPSVVSNVMIDDCRRPIHQVRHDDKIAIFCDGFFPDESVHLGVKQNNQIPIRYVNDTNEATEAYPFNPNGSPGGIASLCSQDGRHLAMMPHPERVWNNFQWPWTPRSWKNHEAGAWLQMFQNARVFCDEN